MTEHCIILGDNDYVLETFNENDAAECFRDYVAVSKSGLGSAGGKEVCWFADGDLRKRYTPAGVKTANGAAGKPSANRKITLTIEVTCAETAKPKSLAHTLDALLDAAVSTGCMDEHGVLHVSRFTVTPGEPEKDEHRELGEP